MVTLSSEDFNHLVDLISGLPAFADSNTRFNWVRSVLQESPRAAALIGCMNLNASLAHLNAISLVQYLTRFGQDVPGREVIALLINGLLREIGESADADFLRGLLGRYPPKR